MLHSIIIKFSREFGKLKKMCGIEAQPGFRGAWETPMNQHQSTVLMNRLLLSMTLAWLKHVSYPMLF